jgi:UDP-N-acetyl-2-amino-2-deoxyglucuronate dehydrogenase
MYRFAIIGCGRIASRHAENIAALGILKAVCDIVPEKAEALARQYNAKAYYSIDELLQKEQDIDIVSICTPNGLHAEHSIKSLQAGRHVLCEKPLCITSAAAWQMIETEKFSRKKLFVVKSTRFNPLLQDLKYLVDQELLGKIYSFQLSCLWNRPDEYYTDWRGKLFPDGGTLYTQFSHYIDALLWLLGDLKSATGYAANNAHQSSIEFEDTGVVAVELKDNILGTMNWSVNAYKKNCEISLALIAEKGTIILGGEYLNELKYQQMDTPFEFRGTSLQSNNYGFYKGSMSNHKEVYASLVEALQNDSPFISSFDGLRTVEAIEKIYKAVNPPNPPQS